MGVACDPRVSAAPDPARQHLRGSSLLLAGRLLSLGVNFGTQVLIARHLPTDEYGALAYALALLSFIGGLATLGLPGALSRMVPIYHERRELDRLAGSLMLSAIAVLAVGLALPLAAFASPELLARLTGGRAEPAQLLLILLFAIPLEGLERLVISFFASFARSKAIFFRRHVLAPALRMGVVVACVLIDAPVVFLAYSYVAASALGLAINSTLLRRLLRDEDATVRWSFRALKAPCQELARFALPLLVADVAMIGMQAISTAVLGYYHDPSQVAYFRVILPAANLNALVMGSFTMLYTPALSRLFARGDTAGINALYWTTAAWMSVLSFPIFIVTFLFAAPVTHLLYGERYAASAELLQILAAAYYFNVALGFNSLTLKVLGKLRFTLAIDLLAIACNVALALLLVPRHGPLGAALATSGAMIFHNVLSQAGLRLVGSISPFERRFYSFFGLLGGCVLSLLVVQRLVKPGLLATVLLALLAAAAIPLFLRFLPGIEQGVPELGRLSRVGVWLRARPRSE